MTEVAIFIASRNTTSTRRRVLWRVSEKDARKICSDPRTASSLTLSAPASADPDAVVREVLRHRDRIASAAVRSRADAPDSPVKDLVRGESFAWLGRTARLRLVDGVGTSVVREHTDSGWWMIAPRELLARRGAQPIIDWYVAEGTAHLKAEAPSWWARIASDHTQPTVRAARMGRTRWASYDPPSHTVRVAWQALQLPRVLVQHLLVHQLLNAARTVEVPGVDFERAFATVMPGAESDRQKLRETGRGIWMGDIS